MHSIPERDYIVGYPDQLSIRTGNSVAFMLSASPPITANIALVKLGEGSETSGVAESVIADLGEVAITEQRTASGSCVIAPTSKWPAGDFTVAAYVMSTRPKRSQRFFAQKNTSESWWVGLDDDARPMAGVRSNDTVYSVTGDAPFVAGAWYLVMASFSTTTGILISASPCDVTPSWTCAMSPLVRMSMSGARMAMPSSGLLESPLVIGARAEIDTWTLSFDGKIEAPTILSGTLDAELVAIMETGRTDSSRIIESWRFEDMFTNGRVVGSMAPARCDATHNAVVMNAPLVATTGHAWNGTEQDFRLAPQMYGAVHFHADDLDDCRWSPTFDLPLDRSLKSGVYALRITGGTCSDRVPFFVRPSSTPTTDLAVLIPTASYLAYANDHPASDGQMCQTVGGKTPVLYDDDMLLHEHREWGGSCYDAHGDGSGVAYSSRLRPLMNMRPTHRYHIGPWQLPADLSIFSWLSQHDINYDIVTDEDLEREGSAAIDPYRVVMTGTHPEYYSTHMLDAVEQWAASGGRLFYTGANGFYWRVAFDQERPWLMEIRRGYAGSRAWESAPGETHLAFSGEQGGLWRHLGRAPQKLTGVGYACQGFDTSGHYRRLSDASDPRAAFIFEGVEGEVFGTSGTIGGGAVGQEMDRYDQSLGSPADALVLATSEGLGEQYLRCVEELNFTVAGTSALVDPDVRGDVVYVVRPGGGAVFATGSIAWAGSLGEDPAISRITENVLRRFLDPAALVW